MIKEVLPIFYLNNIQKFYISNKSIKILNNNKCFILINYNIDKSLLKIIIEYIWKKQIKKINKIKTYKFYKIIITFY